MVVLSHSCLPLTSNLKRFEGADKHDADEGILVGESGFLALLRSLTHSVRKGTPVSNDKRILWDYKYRSLWSPRLTRERDHVVIPVNVWKCSEQTFRGLVKADTYWYKRLPKSGRERVKKLSRDSKGRRHLKDCLDTADGVLLSLIFSFPEMFLEGLYSVSDRIINSVLMQCFHNYSSFQKKLKKLRKEVKRAGLNQEDPQVSPDELRSFSYMSFPIEAFRRIKERTSKSKMFRLAMFTQTRATGLAGVKQAEESIEEFLNTVTIKRQFEPTPLLVQARDIVIQQLVETPVGGNAEFKISMSTAACRESGVRHEGKFGYLKKLIHDSGVKIPELREGISGTLGNWLWYAAKEELRRVPDEVLSVNIAAIRENGKSRIVTSGSFWKDVALQPFSHVTIHLIKTLENLRDGLRAGRLGWRRQERIERTKYDEYNTNWIFDQKGVVSYSVDLSRATDAPTHEMGRWLVGTLLTRTGLSKEDLDTVLSYWVGEKRLFYKGKYVGQMVNGIPMGDPLTKTCLSLAHPVASVYATLKTGMRANQVGNGDDCHAYAEGPEWVLAYEEAIEQLGYEISIPDRAITNHWATYCEEWFYKPVSHINSVKWGNRFKNSNLLPYLDTPKLRVIVATTKDRIDFSSDPSGKVTLLGHDQEYFKRDDPGPLSDIYNVAAAFQDVSLAVLDQKYPLYLPRQVNGVGRAPPYWSKRNWLNILSQCKPWHAKYYLTVMDEYNKGKPGLSGYRGALKESFHFSKEMMVELYEIPKDDPVRRYIAIQSSAWDDWEHGILMKLITSGYLIPESKIAKYYLFQKRLNELEQEQNVDLFECVKTEMRKYPDVEPASQARIVSEFISNYRDSSYRLKQDRRENLYAVEAIRILESGSPLPVSEHPYPLPKKFRKFDTPRNVYEMKCQELYQWFTKAYVARMRGEPHEPPPTDIIEDDPIMVQRIGQGGADLWLLVTDDIRLFKLCCNKYPDMFIFRMSTIHYLQANTYMSENELYWDDEISRCVNNEFEGLTMETLIDKGSVDSYVHKYEIHSDGVYMQVEGIPWNQDVKRTNLQKKPLHGFLHRPRTQCLEELGFPRKYIPEDQYRYLRRRYGRRGLTKQVRSETPP